MRLSAGSPARLGASWDGRGTNFALFSANAEKVELCLFDGQGRRELERIELPERDEDVWHGYLNDVSPGQLYGYRVHGRYEPEHGHRFNPKDRKSTRLNSSHLVMSYAVFCLNKKNQATREGGQGSRAGRAEESLISDDRRGGPMQVEKDHSPYSQRSRAWLAGAEGFLLLRGA